MLGCTSAPFVRCGKKYIKVLTEAILVTINANEGMMAFMVGSVGGYVWRKSDVWSQEVSFELVLTGIWLRSPKVSTFNLFHKDKVCTFNSRKLWRVILRQ